MRFYDNGCFGCLVWVVVAAGTLGIARLLMPLVALLPLYPKTAPLLAFGWGLFGVVWLFWALVSWRVFEKSCQPDCSMAVAPPLQSNSGATALFQSDFHAQSEQTTRLTQQLLRATATSKLSWRWFVLALGWIVGATLFVNAICELVGRFLVLDRDWWLILALGALSVFTCASLALFERVSGPE